MVYLFDANGTLFDDRSLSRKVIHELLIERGIQNPTDEMLRRIAVDQDYAISIGIDSDEFYRQFRRRTQGALTTELIPEGAIDVIREIDRSCGLRAIVTSYYSRGFDKYAGLFKGKDAFSVIVNGDDVTRLKPDPEPVFLALDMLGESGTDKNQAWMIGDTEADIRAGRSAGVRTALYVPDRYQSDYCGNDRLEAQTDVVFSHFSAMLPKIDQFALD